MWKIDLVVLQSRKLNFRERNASQIEWRNNLCNELNKINEDKDDVAVGRAWWGRLDSNESQVRLRVYIAFTSSFIPREN